MGGRGKWSKATETGFTGYDYHKVYNKRGVHFLMQHGHNESGPSAPVMSQKANVTYATLNKKGEVVFISRYEGRKMKWQIDIKEHKGIKPHVHHCDENGYRLENEPLSEMHLNIKQWKVYKKVMGLYASHKKDIIECVTGGKK